MLCIHWSADCPVVGQLFTDCGSACPPNCTDPHPFCTKQCVARCECPDGEVINEATNKCVPIEECPIVKSGNSSECVQHTPCDKLVAYVIIAR